VRAELFELELFGEGVERRYRKMRPEVEAMPWSTLDLATVPAEIALAGRAMWTGAAFQEHRTAVACAAALRALTEARAPIDLIALASRFPLDELVHVELCARMAMAFGGGTEIQHDADHLVADADPSLPPLLRAAEVVVRFFCVGEAISIPLLRGTWHAAQHPLPKAVLGRIVRDEAAHGTFGFAFLDWALPRLDAASVAHLGHQADRAILAVYDLWSKLGKKSVTDEAVGLIGLAWMHTDAYRAVAAKSLEEKVRAPLVRRGLPVTA
jgi:hypothetical protein